MMGMALGGRREHRNRGTFLEVRGRELIRRAWRAPCIGNRPELKCRESPTDTADRIGSRARGFLLCELRNGAQWTGESIATKGPFCGCRGREIKRVSGRSWGARVIVKIY